MNVRKEVINLLSEISGISRSDITEDKLLEETVNWDSYTIMNVLVEIDKKIKKRIDLDRLFEVKTVGELISLVEETIQ